MVCDLGIKSSIAGSETLIKFINSAQFALLLDCVKGSVLFVVNVTSVCCIVG